MFHFVELSVRKKWWLPSPLHACHYKGLHNWKQNSYFIVVLTYFCGHHWWIIIQPLSYRWIFRCYYFHLSLFYTSTEMIIFLHWKLLFCIIFFLDSKFTSTILNHKVYFFKMAKVFIIDWILLWQGWGVEREGYWSLLAAARIKMKKISEHHKKLPIETTNGTIPSLSRRSEKVWNWESFH